MFHLTSNKWINPPEDLKAEQGLLKYESQTKFDGTLGPCGYGIFCGNQTEAI